MDLALNNLQRLICHKIQQTKPNLNWYYSCMKLVLKLFDGFNNRKRTGRKDYYDEILIEEVKRFIHLPEIKMDLVSHQKQK